MEGRYEELAKQITIAAKALQVYYRRGELSNDGFYRQLIGIAINKGAPDSNKMHEYLVKNFSPEKRIHA